MCHRVLSGIGTDRPARRRPARAAGAGGARNDMTEDEEMLQTASRVMA
jgi:hypothetical protein